MACTKVPEEGFSRQKIHFVNFSAFFRPSLSEVQLKFFGDEVAVLLKSRSNRLVVSRIYRLKWMDRDISFVCSFFGLSGGYLLSVDHERRFEEAVSGWVDLA